MTNKQIPHFHPDIGDQQSHPTVFAHSPTSDFVQTDPGTKRIHPAGATRSLQQGRDTFIPSGIPARRLADREATRGTGFSTHKRPSEQGRGELLPKGEAALPRQQAAYSRTVSRTSMQRPVAQAFSQTNGLAHAPGERGRDPDSTLALEEHKERPRRGVRQDKDRNSCDRAASLQPAAVNKFTRSQATSRKSARSKNASADHSSRTVPVQVWVSPVVKAELSRIASQDGLSLSSAGAALLQRGLQANIDMQYGALLRPVIEKAIAKQMAGIATRLTWLLVRIAFDAGQTRCLVTNILNRQKGVTQPVMKTLMDNSNRSAKANIMRRTPQISELISSVEQWMTEDTRGASGKKTHD